MKGGLWKTCRQRRCPRLPPCSRVFERGAKQHREGCRGIPGFRLPCGTPPGSSAQMIRARASDEEFLLPSGIVESLSGLPGSPQEDRPERIALAGIPWQRQIPLAVVVEHDPSHRLQGVAGKEVPLHILGRSDQVFGI
jgi:hypothetical protein